MATHRFVVISDPTDTWDEQKKAVWEAEGKQSLARFLEDGTLLRAGRYTNAADGGGIAIFATREAAEAYVADSPFLRAGVLKHPQILEWLEITADVGAPTA